MSTLLAPTTAWLGYRAASRAAEKRQAWRPGLLRLGDNRPRRNQTDRLATALRQQATTNDVPWPTRDT